MKEDLIITFTENMFATTTVYLTSFYLLRLILQQIPECTISHRPENSLDSFASDVEKDVMCF
jgi:hypothetical protein